MSGASEQANGRASDPVLTSRFLFVPDHSAMVNAYDDDGDGNSSDDDDNNHLSEIFSS